MKSIPVLQCTVSINLHMAGDSTSTPQAYILPTCRIASFPSKGILDCPGARTSECTRGQENSVVYHHTNTPGALIVKAGEKLVSTNLAASTACQESRLGTTSGKGCYSPNVRADDFEATCSQIELLSGAAPTEGCWTFFLRKRLRTVRNYY